MERIEEILKRKERQSHNQYSQRMKMTNPCKQKQDKQVIENENVITKRKLSTEWLEDKLKKITPKTETKQKY